MYSSTLLTSLALASSALAGYEVHWDYSGASFFENFEFINVRLSIVGIFNRSSLC